ncbi:MAG TPA: DUF1573 domain-containing protein [Isosphaeraceae bacterium]|jgi:hypothetical protein|nr:DUF1573 domain-containing protein [Isosphaeraceae bacterium]
MARLGTRTRTVIGWVTICGLAMMTYAGVSGLAPKPAEKSGKKRLVSPPSLTVPDSILDFGKVAANRQFRLTLPIQNTAVRDITIADFGMTCQCVSVRPSRLVIPKGQVREVVATLDLTRGFTDPKTSALNFQANVSPQGDNGRSLATFPVHGRVFRAFSFDPPVVRFDDDLIRGGRFPARSVEVTSTEPLSGSPVARCNPAFATVRLTPLEGAGSYRLEVAPKETLTNEFYDFDIRIDGTLVGGADVSGELNVVARIVDDVACLPEAILSRSAVVFSQD